MTFSRKKQRKKKNQTGEMSIGNGKRSRWHGQQQMGALAVTKIYFTPFQCKTQALYLKVLSQKIKKLNWNRSNWRFFLHLAAVCVTLSKQACKGKLQTDTFHMPIEVFEGRCLQTEELGFRKNALSCINGWHLALTFLLFPALPLIADLDGTHWQDDSNDKK